MKRDLSKTKTIVKRPRSPRLPNPKEQRRTIQFRVTDGDEAAIRAAIAAAAKHLGITPSVSDMTRMAVVAYPTHARELAEANRAREAAETKVAVLRKQIADLQAKLNAGGVPIGRAPIDENSFHEAEAQDEGHEHIVVDAQEAVG